MTTLHIRNLTPDLIVDVFHLQKPFGGFSGSRGLAVGAGAGFIGGAVAGVAAVSMYHQYRQYQSLLYCHSNPMCYGTGYSGKMTKTH
jgi:hypothetical protein